MSKKKKKECNLKDDESLLNCFTFCSSPEVNQYKTKSVSKNTQKSTQWSLKIFDDWVEARRQTGKKCPPKGILSTQSPQLLCTWLCRFFTEKHKSDGNPYCPCSLSSIFAGLQHHIEVISECEGSMHLTGPEFKHLHTLLENLYKQLHEDGVGTTKAQAEIITLEEEQKIWETIVFGTDTLENLLNAVFYYNGLNFALRGGSEHRDLSISQFVFSSESVQDGDSMKFTTFVEYIEFGYKNR